MGVTGVQTCALPILLFAGIFAAIIIPRIPPLSKKADTFHLNKTQQVKEAIPEGHTAFSWGVDQAVERASKNTSLVKILQEGIENVLDMWIGVAPVEIGRASCRERV